MILVDANLLLHAYDASSGLHDAARRFLEERLSRPEPVCLAWITIVAFIRISTHVRVFQNPLTPAEACAAVTAWLARPMVRILDPGPRHWEIVQDLLIRSQAAGNLASDAHLAAVALEYGLVLMSTDRDFARFEGLAWKDPLAASPGS
jgi:toxin-antitoxin system PIN domain toxin